MACPVPAVERMSTVLRALVLVCLAVFVACAQSDQWPFFFSVPQRGATADSAVLKMSGTAKVFESYEKARTDLEWQPSVKGVRLRQNGVLETTHDETYGAINQLYDFSGRVAKDSLFFRNGSLGLEWTPVSYLNLRDTNSGFQTTGDLGPFVEMRLYDVPIMLKGGISGSSWSDSLPPSIARTRREDVHGDAGFYGACRVGDSSAPLRGTSLYANGGAFVRSISQAGLAVMTGSLLFAHGLGGGGDSLFAFYGDSLSNGKEQFWGNTGGRQQYINTPWRIARSYLAAGGIKAGERLGFSPSLLYSYAQNSVAYPTIQSVLSDVRQGLHSLNFLLGSETGLPFVYHGGLKISWGAENWLYKSDLSSSALNLPFLGPEEQKRLTDSLNVELLDHDKNLAITDHVVGLTLPGGILLSYKLAAFRDSRTYTFSYRQGPADTATIGNSEDNDRISVNNRAGIALSQFHGLDAELYGVYSTYILNYIKKERSAGNYIEKGYRVGLNATYRPTDRFTIDERLSADAEVSEFIYKSAHRNPFDPPPYQRRLSSLLSGVWKVRDGWDVLGKWAENLYDAGYWYGRAYRKDDSLLDKSGYYAIDNKTIDYTLEAACAMVRTALRIEGGCLFREIFDLRFEEDRYISTGKNAGYIIEPYTEFRMQFRRFSLRGRITRMIKTRNDDRLAFRKNWDVSILGTALW
jgi:hypothetical protein